MEIYFERGSLNGKCFNVDKNANIIYIPLPEEPKSVYYTKKIKPPDLAREVYVKHYDRLTGIPIMVYKITEPY